MVIIENATRHFVYPITLVGSIPKETQQKMKKKQATLHTAHCTLKKKLGPKKDSSLRGKNNTIAPITTNCSYKVICYPLHIHVVWDQHRAR